MPTLLSHASQALRRGLDAKLGAALRQGDAEPADTFVARIGRKSWKKRADVSLANYLAAKIRSRPARGLSSKAADSELLASARRKASRTRAGR